jgi:hypothetical protein
VAEESRSVLIGFIFSFSSNFFLGCVVVLFSFRGVSCFPHMASETFGIVGCNGLFAVFTVLIFIKLCNIIYRGIGVEKAVVARRGGGGGESKTDKERARARACWPGSTCFN